MAGYELLRQHCDQIFVMGLSMGGALALMLASQVPVAGVVTLSAVYDMPILQHPLLPMHILLDRVRGTSYLVMLTSAIGMFAVFLFVTF